MYNIKKRKLIFKNQVYKVYSNNIKSKRINIKDYLSIEVKGKTFGGVCCLIFKNNSIGLMKIYSPITKNKTRGRNCKLIALTSEKSFSCWIRYEYNTTSTKTYFIA